MAKSAVKNKAPAKEAVAVPKQGDLIEFLGYSEEVDDPMFTKGDILVVHSAKEDGDDVKVTARLNDGDKDGPLETLYMPDEAKMATAKGKATKESAPSKKTKAKAAEPEEEEFDEDEEQEEEKAPAKKTSKSKAVAPKAKSAPARTKDEAEEEEMEHSASVKKLIKKGDMLEAAKSLVNQASQSYFNLGGILAEIHRTKAYAAKGYEGDGAFEDYINTELGIEYRKAMMLVKIYKVFSKLGVDEARLISIGWTKASAIAAYMPADSSLEDFEAMIDGAEEYTRDELISTIKDSYVGSAASTDRVKRVKYTFTAFADEAEYIGQSLSKAMEMTGDEDVGEAFKYIIRDWAANADGVDISVEDAIKVVEKRFGVKLEVADGSKENEMPRMKTVKSEKPAKAAPVKAKATKAKAEKAPAKVVKKAEKPAAKTAVKKAPAKAPAKTVAKAKGKGKKVA